MSLRVHHPTLRMFNVLLSDKRNNTLLLIRFNNKRKSAKQNSNIFINKTFGKYLLRKWSTYFQTLCLFPSGTREMSLADT